MIDEIDNFPLLTISVPTFNRASYLRFQLTAIQAELATLRSKGQVAIFVSDNGSTDQTYEVLEEFSAKMPELSFVRKPQNEGPDRNISFCFFYPQTQFVWVLGDDDAPLAGSLAPLVKLLRAENPDLVYLPSVPTRNIHDDYACRRVSGPTAVVVTQRDFGHLLHVQMTFISGLIVRKDAATQAAVHDRIELTDGTNLIQLAWVYERLANGKQFAVFRDPMLIATAANSGGYSTVKVFFIYHSRLVMNLLSSHPELGRSVLSQTALCFLPGLIWNLRTGNIGAFEVEEGVNFELPRELTKTIGFRALVAPVWYLPRPLASVFFLLSRLAGFIVRQINAQFIFSRRRQIGPIK